METKASEDPEKPWKKSVRHSWENDEPVKERPELPWEEETHHADQETPEPHRQIPIQRNSIFNHAIRHRSKTKTRDNSEKNTGHHQAGSLENGKSANEPLALKVPQSRTPPWRIPTQTDPAAQKTRAANPPWNPDFLEPLRLMKP